MIKYSGRKQTRSQVFDTLELCQKYNLAVNIDLIYGWPEQTIERMLEDLQTVIDTGIGHITHYELNVAGRSNFASHKLRDVLPSIDTNIEMYKASCEKLRANGFEQETVYDWERKESEDNLFKSSLCGFEGNLRDSIEHNKGDVNSIQQMCGIGFAAINLHANGFSAKDQSWVYMNHRSLEKYYEDLDNGQFPIERGFMYDLQDTKLVWLFVAMQTMKINYLDYQDIFQENLLDTYSSVWTELEKRQWLKVSSSEIIFINEGQYYIPMLQSLIANKRLAQIRGQKQKLGDITVASE